MENLRRLALIQTPDVSAQVEEDKAEEDEPLEEDESLATAEEEVIIIDSDSEE